jgi:transposase
MEACSGAHFIAAKLRDQGHEVRLMPAQFVKPFVKSNKNDFIDAEAIAEAVTRQNMRFVPIKTDDQLDPQALHRVRDRRVHRRTALINQIRGFLLERGITFAKGPANLRRSSAANIRAESSTGKARLKIDVRNSGYHPVASNLVSWLQTFKPEDATPLELGELDLICPVSLQPAPMIANSLR